jgi:hypothetical protein
MASADCLRHPQTFKKPHGQNDHQPHNPRRTKRLQAGARMASVVSATSCARRRLIRSVRPTQMSDANKISAGSIWRSIALGLSVGLVISGLSGLFTGAGHGWGSGVISSSSIVGAPLAIVAWAMRGRASARTVAVIALQVGVLTDAWLWIATVSEGVSYVGKVWNSMPLLLLLWLILFVGWQLVAAIAVQTPASTNSP